MTVASELCMEALKTAGIVGLGQTAQQEDIARTFNALNNLLSLWQRRRWLIWHLVETAVIANGNNFYTIGPGGDFNLDPRPDGIPTAFNRQLTPYAPAQVDNILEEIKSWEDWAAISLKTLKSFPSYYFFDTGFPMGKLYVYPVPLAGIYEIHILTKEALGQFANTSAPVTMPLEYEAALQFNLARRVRAMYRKPADPELNALARDATNVIRMANTQIPRLTMPSDLVPRHGYNIFSDQSR